MSRDGSGYCKQHKSGWDKAGRPSRHARGYGKAWEKLRAQILKRDRYLCQPCLRGGRPTPASEVDHITPKAEGGTDHPDNCQSICHPCHNAKTRAESRRARGIRPLGCGPDGMPTDPDHPWSKCKES